MFQRTTIFAFFALALPLTAHAFAEDEQPQKSDTLALQKLTEKIDALEWNNATLEKVLTDLAAKLAPDTPIDWNALETIGAKKDDLITLELKNVMPDEVLWRIGLTQEWNEILDFGVEDGKFSITTGGHANRKTFTQIYDVGDLLKLGQDAKENETVTWSLLNLVTGMVAYESWAQINDTPWTATGPAPYSIIKSDGAKFIVKTKASVHLHFARFLELVRGKGPAFTPENATQAKVFLFLDALRKK